jgi:RND family efflux transporter MFP subunit
MFRSEKGGTLSTGEKPVQHDLSALRIHREPEKTRRPFVALLVGGVVAVALGAAVYVLVRGTFSAESVDTVTASLVTEGQATTILSATGYVEADTKADLSPKITSKVTALYVNEGDRVQKGQILARLDSSDLDAQLAQARAQWVNADAELKRQKALLADGVTSQANVDTAVAAEKAARAQVDFYKAQEDYAVIRAPFSGRVTAKRAHVGEAVSPFGSPGQGSANGGAIVTLVDFSTLYVGADINEANLAKLGPRQPAEIALDAYPNHPYPGHLLQVIPTADRAKGTVKVKVAFDRLDDRVLPEMSARVNFTEKPTGGSKAKSRVMVPRAAVRAAPSGPEVVKVSDGRAVVQRVTLGPENQGEVEILSGLSGGETLVADPGKHTLKTGDRVKVKQE